MTRAPHLLFGCLVVVAPFLGVHLAYAGAWTQKESSGQIINSASVYHASRYFDALGAQHPQPKFYKQELSTYAEYGVYSDLTLGTQINLARAYQANTSSTSSSWNIGDTELFARKRLWQNDQSVFSLQPFVILPSPDDGSNMPKVGSDHAAGGVRAAYGRNFKALGRSHYADISGAYVYRSGHPADQLKLDATVGFNVGERWQVIQQLFITQSTHRMKNAAFTQSDADDYDLFKLQLTIQYQLDKKRALQIGGFHHLSGKNTGAGNGILFSYVRNF